MTVRVPVPCENGSRLRVSVPITKLRGRDSIEICEDRNGFPIITETHQESYMDYETFIEFSMKDLGYHMDQATAKWEELLSNPWVERSRVVEVPTAPLTWDVADSQELDDGDSFARPVDPLPQESQSQEPQSQEEFPSASEIEQAEFEAEARQIARDARLARDLSTMQEEIQRNEMDIGDISDDDFWKNRPAAAPCSPTVPDSQACYDINEFAPIIEIEDSQDAAPTCSGSAGSDGAGLGLKRASSSANLCPGESPPKSAKSSDDL